MRKRKSPDVAHRFKSTYTVPALFELAHEIATIGLLAPAVARLAATPVGNAAALAWMKPEHLGPLLAYCGTLASRDIGRRYRLAGEQRRKLQEFLGEDFVKDPQRWFLLAFAIDQAFTNYGVDYEDPAVEPKSRTTPPRPKVFFDEVSNPPPALGQMTPLAVCRKWFRNFWVLGQPGALRGFGRFPAPTSVPLPGRTKQTLDDAVTSGELVIAALTWRTHASENDLNQLAAPPGTFAVAGFRNALADGAAMSKAIKTVADAQCHVLLLPEVALTPDDLVKLQKTLEDQGRRLPALTIAGLTHRDVRPGGNFVNEAVVLDARGKVLFRHEKLEPFTDRLGRIECILPRLSDQYLFMDTPVGRVVVNVCRDVRSDIPMILNRAVCATVLLVPTYSRALDFVNEEARILGQRQGAITLGINPTAGHLADAALLYAPIRGKGSSVLVSQEELRTGIGGGDSVVLIFKLGRSASGVGSVTRVQ